MFLRRMTMNKKNFGICGMFAVSALSMAFVACGDDVTEVTQSGIGSVASIKEAKCSADNEGESVFAKDENAVYVCSDKKWVNVSAASGAEATSCTVGQAGADSVFVKCGDKTVGVKAPAATNGASCEVEKSDAQYIYFKCGEETSKVLLPKPIAETDSALAKQLAKVYRSRVRITMPSVRIDRFYWDFQDSKMDKVEYLSFPSVQVSVEELNPKTGYPTGKIVMTRGFLALPEHNNDDNYFVTDLEVSNLESPVVRLRAEIGAFAFKENYSSREYVEHHLGEQTYYAVVNLESDSAVYVSLATDLKAARIQNLMAGGKTYKQADEIANADLFSAFAAENFAKNYPDEFGADAVFDRVETYDDYDMIVKECKDEIESGNQHVIEKCRNGPI